MFARRSEVLGTLRKRTPKMDAVNTHEMWLTHNVRGQSRNFSDAENFEHLYTEKEKYHNPNFTPG